MINWGVSQRLGNEDKASRAIGPHSGYPNSDLPNQKLLGLTESLWGPAEVSAVAIGNTPAGPRPAGCTQDLICTSITRFSFTPLWIWVLDVSEERLPGAIKREY